MEIMDVTEVGTGVEAELGTTEVVTVVVENTGHTTVTGALTEVVVGGVAIAARGDMSQEMMVHRSAGVMMRRTATRLTM